MRDLKNNLGAAASLNPAARTASADGAGVDLDGFDSAMVVFAIGLYTNGSFTPLVKESDDNVTFTEVAAADLEGSLTVIDDVSDDNTVQRVGYKGNKRYIAACVAEGSSPAPGTGLVIGGSVVRGHAHGTPVA